MNQKERMLQGLPYKAWMDGLAEERREFDVEDYCDGVMDMNGLK